MSRTPRTIPDYDAIFEPVRKARMEKSGKQLGDPGKAARAMLAVIDADHPPVHLLLGSDALQLVRSNLSTVASDLCAWEHVTVSTDG
jgi:hypothetical protein